VFKLKKTDPVFQFLKNAGGSEIPSIDLEALEEIIKKDQH